MTNDTPILRPLVETTTPAAGSACGHSGQTGPKCNRPLGRIRVSTETRNRPTGPAFGQSRAGAGCVTTITAPRLLRPKANDDWRQVTTNKLGPIPDPEPTRNLDDRKAPDRTADLDRFLRYSTRDGPWNSAGHATRL